MRFIAFVLELVCQRVIVVYSFVSFLFVSEWVKEMMTTCVCVICGFRFVTCRIECGNTFYVTRTTDEKICYTSSFNVLPAAVKNTSRAKPGTAMYR